MSESVKPNELIQQVQYLSRDCSADSGMSTATNRKKGRGRPNAGQQRRTLPSTTIPAISGVPSGDKENLLPDTLFQDAAPEVPVLRRGTRLLRATAGMDPGEWHSDNHAYAM